MFLHGIRPYSIAFIEIGRHPVRLFPFHTADIVFANTDRTAFNRGLRSLQDPGKGARSLPFFGIVAVGSDFHKPSNTHTQTSLSLRKCRFLPVYSPLKDGHAHSRTDYHVDSIIGLYWARNHVSRVQYPDQLGIESLYQKDESKNDLYLQDEKTDYINR